MTEDQRERIKALQLDINAVINNMRYGATFDEAIEYSKGKTVSWKKGYALDVEGLVYTGIPNVAFAYDVKEEKLREAYKKEKDIVKALAKARDEVSCSRYVLEYNGRLYKNRKDLANDLDIDYVVLCTNLKKYGCVDDAVERCLEIKQLQTEKFEFNGKEFDNFVEACKHYGVEFSEVMRVSGKQGVKPSLVLNSYINKR